MSHPAYNSHATPITYVTERTTPLPAPSALCATSPTSELLAELETVHIALSDYGVRGVDLGPHLVQFADDFSSFFEKVFTNDYAVPPGTLPHDYTRLHVLARVLSDVWTSFNIRNAPSADFDSVSDRQMDCDGDDTDYESDSASDMEDTPSDYEPSSGPPTPAVTRSATSRCAPEDEASLAYIIKRNEALRLANDPFALERGELYRNGIRRANAVYLSPGEVSRFDDDRLPDVPPVDSAVRVTNPQ